MEGASSPQPTEGTDPIMRAWSYAKWGGALGLIAGATGGFLIGGIGTVSTGFNNSAALLYLVLGGLGGAIYLALSGGLIGFVGVRERPILGAQAAVFLFTGFGFALGSSLGSSLGVPSPFALIGGLCAAPPSLALALRLFGLPSNR